MNDQLKALVERIERLEEDKAGLGSDIGDVYKEAEAGGFDKKALKRVIALRKMAKADREALDEIVTLYFKELEG